MGCLDTTGKYVLDIGIFRVKALALEQMERHDGESYLGDFAREIVVR